MSQGREANIFDLLIAFVASVSLCSISLLVLGIFNPITAVTAGAILFLVFGRIFRLSIANDRRFGMGIFVILLIALLFRAKPYLHIAGRDDPGIYVNMSSYYAEKGTPFITDEVRRHLTDEQKAFYDAENQYEIQYMKPGKHMGMHLPCIYIKDFGKSEYVFRFYPLHPLWMGIVAQFFGGENRVYSLVFFSLISIIGFYLIALEISDNNRFAANFVALCLAVNPAHAYFSKSPATEVVMLAFSSTSLYYLIRYYKSNRNGRVYSHYLFLSAGLAFCLFFTKIVGFMYIPFYYALFLMTILFMEKGAIRNRLIWYFLAIFSLYALSVAYGMIFSYPYSYQIYTKTAFPKVFGHNWQRNVLMAVSLSAIFALSLFHIRDRIPERAINKARLLFYGNLHYILFMAILLGVYTAYQLAFTEKYILYQTKQYFEVAGTGWKSLKYASIVAVISYMSPFAFLLFLGAIRHYRKRKDILINGLIMFLIPFWLYGTVLRWQTPYQYYWVRYLVSEVLPYSILLVCLYVGYLYAKGGLLRFFAYLSCVLVITYPLYFTMQYFLNETGAAVGVDQSLKIIAGYMDEDDLVLICKEGNFGGEFPYKGHGKIRTRLSYYFHLNVMDIGTADTILTAPLSEIILDGKFKDVYVISRKRLNRDFLEPVDALSYRFRAPEDSSTFPPTTLFWAEANMFLHKIDKDLLLKEATRKKA